MILALGVWAFVRALLVNSAAVPLENVVLRHQRAVLQRSVGRPRLRRRDRLFWVALSQLWAGWRASLLIVQPAIVLAWHRQRFHLYWRWKSRCRSAGRPPLDLELRTGCAAWGFGSRGSGAGWEYLHVAVDDHSRVAYVELLPDEGQVAARRFLRGALRWFRAHGVRVRRILTDNGSAYRSRSFRAACRALRVTHRRTRPYTPRTNGKAERFIQTALREWAYRRPYYTSADRGRVLPGWLEHYNCARPHTSVHGPTIAAAAWPTTNRRARREEQGVDTCSMSCSGCSVSC
jgi:transposase InsO family protein